MNNLFVYGAMKRGEPLHLHLKKGAAEYVGKGVVSGYALYKLNSYCALVRGHLGEVEGELYRVESSALDVLDGVEGVYQGLFERDMVYVHLDAFPDEEPIQAVSYIFIAEIPNTAELIRSGIWTSPIRPVPTQRSSE